MSPCLQQLCRFVFCSTPLPRLRTVGSGEWGGWLKDSGRDYVLARISLCLNMSKSLASCIRLLEKRFTCHLVFIRVEMQLRHSSPAFRGSWKARAFHRWRAHCHAQHHFAKCHCEFRSGGKSLVQMDVSPTPQSWDLSQNHNHCSRLDNPVLVGTSCRSPVKNTVVLDMSHLAHRISHPFLLALLSPRSEHPSGRLQVFGFRSDQYGNMLFFENGKIM